MMLDLGNEVEERGQNGSFQDRFIFSLFSHCMFDEQKRETHTNRNQQTTDVSFKFQCLAVSGLQSSLLRRPLQPACVECHRLQPPQRCQKLQRGSRPNGTRSGTARPGANTSRFDFKDLFSFHPSQHDQRFRSSPRVTVRLEPV